MSSQLPIPPPLPPPPPPPSGTPPKSPKKSPPRPTSSTSILRPSLTRNATGNSVTFADRSNTTKLEPLTLDRITSAQFEDEATTAIIAALEEDNLIGEDISEDEEEVVRKARTYSTDSFIKNLRKQGDLQQYRSSPVGARDGHASSSSESHHRYHSSMLSAGFLPGVPDGSAIESLYEGEDSDENFVRGVQEGLSKSSSDLKSATSEDQEEKGGAERTLSDIEENEEEEEEPTSHSAAAETINDPLKLTSVTKNLNTMGQRLKMMQRAGSSRSLPSSFRSQKSHLHDGGSGDALLNALSAASKNETNGFWRKMRYEYNDLIAPQMPRSIARISRMLFFAVFPLLGVASMLFYMLENPMAGDSGTSVSWWILFVVRQGLMFEFARVGEVFWVEIMALRSKLFTSAFGPYVALAIIQSKGWPYMCIFWPVLDFCFLYGSNAFVKHWLFWQQYLDLFNENNPVNGVTDAPIYLRILCAILFVGVIVSLKRLTLAIYLGRRTVKHFGQELETLMAKMILIGEVAHLAKDIETRHSAFPGALLQDDEKIVQFRNMVMADSVTGTDQSPAREEHKTLPSERGAKMSQRDNLSSHDSEAAASTTSETTKFAMQQSTNANIKLLNLLDEWEEPESLAQKNAKASVQDLLQFRQAVAFMNDSHPFSRAFGLANTREATIESAQKVFDRLVLGLDDENGPLPFSVFSVLALDEQGQLMTAKIKSLIRLFRPDRSGELTRLDYTKSIDTVYKELRLLRASIANSGQIDIAFEKIVNSFFYFFVTIIAVTILGIDIWSVFLSINTLILGASFLFGSAASLYFEGLLLIFVRRPYDIGDKIATSSPSTDTSGDGSSTWFVDRVTLFTTTVRFATTNEVATLSNGSLARLRIINANRSPKAQISVIIKFGLETPFQRVTIFRTAVENFIKARPREWIALSAFRVTRVEADAGYVEYKIIGQHRERWQNIGPILQSKADLSSFCLEVSKKLDMRYESPPMPVNLSASGNAMKSFFADSDGSSEDVDAVNRGRVQPSFSSEDLQAVNKLFEIRKSM